MPQLGGFMPPVRYTACMKPAVQPGDFALREGGSISSPGIHFNADKPPTKSDIPPINSRQGLCRHVY
jgi:hypothetical protein